VDGVRRVFTRLWSRPYLLLVLTMLMWGGNAVAGRLAVGQVSPMALTALRWLLPVVILGVALRRELVRHRYALRERWPLVVLMGTLGFTVFNALMYVALHHTTAVNTTILQGSMPVFVLVGALAVYGTPIRGWQVAGMAVTLVGTLLITTRADPAVLASLSFNIGDLWMLMACCLYAGYTVALRAKPAVPGLVFFATLAAVALMTSLPLVAYEIASGSVRWPTPQGWLIVLYVGLLPSFVSQVMFMRSVELIGPGRAGLFVNLVPIFGALLAVLILGEPFAAYHAAGLALVLGGIWLAERRQG
jgi:drug/metabolite transporter (DMT)-like permease